MRANDCGTGSEEDRGVARATLPVFARRKDSGAAETGQEEAHARMDHIRCAGRARGQESQRQARARWMQAEKTPGPSQDCRAAAPGAILARDRGADGRLRADRAARGARRLARAKCKVRATAQLTR
jgi:hypothetical protein